MENADFDYIIEALEHSYLPPSKRAAFAMLLLSATSRQVAGIAASLRKDPQALGVLALTALTNGRFSGEKRTVADGSGRILNEEELMIKDATVNS